MKRFLTTLAILIVVIVAGLSALVLLINPNDFRSYLVERVEKQSGYKLTLQDDMRWHVWPKLSIITGKMSLKAPGAEQPLVIADNMRLDVELLPLLSHQLEIKEVMLKGAVIQQTPESQAIPKVTPPSLSRNQTPAVTVIEQNKNRWQLNIAQVNVTDSLLIWQLNDNEQLNLRDINLSLETDENQQISLKMSSKVSRDRREVTFNMNATADMSRYPYQINGDISQFDYTLLGAGLPEMGIQGNLTTDFTYKNDKESQLSFENFILVANESQLKGNLKAELADKPRYQIELTSDLLNLDTLLPNTAKVATAQNLRFLPASSENAKSASFPWINYANASSATSQSAITRPVIATSTMDNREYDLTHWNNVDFSLGLTINKLIYKGLEINHFALQAENQHDLLDIQTLSGELLNGHFSLPTAILTAVVPAEIHTNISLKDIALQPLLKAFNQSENFSGIISVEGKLSGKGYNSKALLNNWHGTLDTKITQVKMEGLNIPQLIQQSVAQMTDKVISPENIDSFTQADHVSANLVLAEKGRVKLQNIEAKADAYRIKGQGDVNIQRRDLDVELQVNITKGWGKDNEFTRQLAQINIPLRLYGNWNSIQYEFDVEKLIRDELQQKAKQAIDNWLNKQNETPEVKALNQLLKKL